MDLYLMTGLLMIYLFLNSLFKKIQTIQIKMLYDENKKLPQILGCIKFSMNIKSWLPSVFRFTLVLINIIPF